MIHRTWTLAALAGLLLVASCDGLTSSERDPAAGTYVLATIEGSPVPFEEWSGISGWTMILSGEITLRPDRTFRVLTDRKHFFRDPQGERLVSDTVQGRYTRQGGMVVLTAESGKADTLSLEGTTVTRRARIVSSPQPVPWGYRR